MPFQADPDNPTGADGRPQLRQSHAFHDGFLDRLSDNIETNLQV